VSRFGVEALRKRTPSPAKCIYNNRKRGENMMSGWTIFWICVIVGLLTDVDFSGLIILALILWLLFG
jgi:hypothetical protein